jgi:hypothetical protein
MNWDAIGAIGEIVGASAVVISLLYLGFQIRAQTRQAKLAALHDISAGFREAVGHFSDTEMAQLFIKSLTGMEELEDYERFKMLIGCQKCLRVWEEAFHLHRNHQLEGENWDGMDRQFRALLSTPLFQYAWVLRREFYSEEFRKMVEQSSEVEYRIS